MSAASKKVMEKLHAALAETFTEILNEGKTVIDKETGEPVKVTPDAATLGAIRQFLKDNGIEAAEGKSEALNALAGKSLPFMPKPDEHGLN